MRIPKYPYEFYDFSNGVDVSENEINKWIKKGLTYLRNN